VAILAVGALLFGCGNAPPPGAVGSTAPEYAARMLDGDTISLVALRGQPVLLNVWATWCPPCRKEMPELQALHEELGPKGLYVLGVSIDAAGADEIVREFLDEYDITFAIARDPDERVTTAFPAQGVPITVLIDPEGTIVWRHLGPVSADQPDLRAALARVLPGTV